MAQLDAKIGVAIAVVLLAGAVLSGQAIRNVPRISIDELKVLMEQKAVLVIDVRDPESFAKGRIPGAVNVDYTQVLKEAAQFAGDKRTIVTYCACANEMTAARGDDREVANAIALLLQPASDPRRPDRPRGTRLASGSGPGRITASTRFPSRRSRSA